MGFENSAGLGNRNHYGPRVMGEARKFGARKSINAAGNVEVEWVFDYDDLPGANGTNDDSLEATLPVGCWIESAKVQVLTAIAGTTPTLTIGLVEPDGSTLDADGIDVAIAEAALDAVNEWVDCDGALVQATTGLAAKGQLVASTGGTVTAGRFLVVIEYKEAEADPTGNYVAGGVKGA